MAFPSLIPSSREYDGGDYPVKTFKAQSGAESRILYGSRRTGMTLNLSFEHITDTQVQTFLTHYDETKGTYTTFSVPKSVFTGWSGSAAALDAATGNSWRYSESPVITNTHPGISSVRVKLVGVL